MTSPSRSREPSDNSEFRPFQLVLSGAILQPSSGYRMHPHSQVGITFTPTSPTDYTVEPDVYIPAEDSISQKGREFLNQILKSAQYPRTAGDVHKVPLILEHVRAHTETFDLEESFLEHSWLAGALSKCLEEVKGRSMLLSDPNSQTDLSAYDRAVATSAVHATALAISSAFADIQAICHTRHASLAAKVMQSSQRIDEIAVDTDDADDPNIVRAADVKKLLRLLGAAYVTAAQADVMATENLRVEREGLVNQENRQETETMAYETLLAAHAAQAEFTETYDNADINRAKRARVEDLNPQMFRV